MAYFVRQFKLLLRASVQEESALSSLEKLSDCLAVFVDSIFVLRSRSGIIGCQGWFEVRITFFFHNLPVFQLITFRNTQIQAIATVLEIPGTCTVLPEFITNFPNRIPGSVKML